MWDWVLDGLATIWKRFFGGFVLLFQWMLPALRWVLEQTLNRIQYVTIALLATFSGFAPTQTLAEMWASIVSHMSWLSGPVAYVALYWFDFGELLARMTYFGEALAAAYAIRLAFVAIRAVFDLL